MTASVGDEADGVALGGKHSISPHRVFKSERFFFLGASHWVLVRVEPREVVDGLVRLLAQDDIFGKLREVGQLADLLVRRVQGSAGFPIGLTV